MYYKNALNVEKTRETYSSILDFAENNNLVNFSLTSSDYKNTFSYLDDATRRSSHSRFAIDAKQEMLVETTEQLLQAVEFGYKPKFYGNSYTAKTVYDNAKEVLVYIIPTNMTDTQKVTKIFDWISYAFNLNLYAQKNIKDVSFIDLDVSEYGLRQDFYLEGIFLNILNPANGNSDGEFYLGNSSATSNSYAKAFSLLCSIEGIETISVHGTYNNKPHHWNKVYVDNSWYNVDITLSDNKILTETSAISASSHAYFLVSDTAIFYETTQAENDGLQQVVRLTENTSSISDALNDKIRANNNYNYYANSSFGLTEQQVKSILQPNYTPTAFEYTKQ